MSRWILASYEGPSMVDICPYTFDGEDKNHCAHFVSHALQIFFGYTCAAIKGMPCAPAAANIRVHEIFDRCPKP